VPGKGDWLRAGMEALRGIVTVLDIIEVDDDLIQMTYRVDASKRAIWINILDAVLGEEERAIADGGRWRLHLCRQFVRHEGKMKAAWNFTIHGDIDTGTKDVARLLDILSRTEPRSPTRTVARPVPRTSYERVDDSVPNANSGTMRGKEVIDFPLVGQTENRNKPLSPLLSKGSKGAHMLTEK